MEGVKPDLEKIIANAQQLLQEGKVQQGRDLLVKVCESDPNNRVALLMLGGIYFTDQQFDTAEMIYRHLVSLFPSEGKLSIALVNCLQKQGKFIELQTEIKRFIDAADKNAERATIEQYLALSEQLAG